MSIQNQILKFAPFLSLKMLINLTGKYLVLPFYHTVSDVSLPHVKHLYPVLDSKTFEKQLDYFLKFYNPISALELLQKIKSGEKIKEERFFLSFDDGLKEFYEVAAPILTRKGIPAACFVNTDFIDNKAMFYRLKVSLLVEKATEKTLTTSQITSIKKILDSYKIDFQQKKDFLKIRDKEQAAISEIAKLMEIDFEDFLRKNKPYLTSEQINELIQQGFTIGSHSVYHPYFPYLTTTEQVKETLDSMRFLIRNFEIKERFFSFPYTDFGVKKTFFDQISPEVDLTFGTASLKNDSIITNLQRIPMERNKTAENIIKEAYVNTFLKKILKKNIIFRD